MSRIRGLELLFNLVKEKIKSKQDCIVISLHCLLINEELQCVGIGEEFTDEDARLTTELLPKEWNDNQEVYTLRYISKDAKNRYLVKIVKAGNILHVNVVLNEDKAAAMSASITKLISDDFSNYAAAYNDLDSLKNAFQKDIVEKLMAKPTAANTSKSTNKSSNLRMGPAAVIRPPMSMPPPEFGDDSPFADGRPAFPQIGGRDLDPLGRDPGGMLLDPSSFGVPRGGHMPPFGPGPGLPRGAVPPGARFDPFGPPIRGPDRFKPNPDHFRPPDFDDFM